MWHRVRYGRDVEVDGHGLFEKNLPIMTEVNHEGYQPLQPASELCFELVKFRTQKTYANHPKCRVIRVQSQTH
jgi:hypothetical protein